MKDLQREILTQVAAGSLSAEEAAARLEALDAGPPEPAETRSPSPSAPTGTRTVRLVSQFGNAEVVGDPSVAFALAEGPHRARQDGGTMVIDHAVFDEDDSFAFSQGGSRRLVMEGFDWRHRKLFVRMNPELALEVSVQAGNVRVSGVHGPIS